MKLCLQKHPNNYFNHTIEVGGSKSISNRLLIVNALYQNAIELKNLSSAQDTKILQEALQQRNAVIDVHHAGTAMRFLTAFLAFQTNKTITLTGSARMQERPIKILVNALNQLGAKIEYINKVGFPPLSIRQSKNQRNSIALDASVSSQYISALILIAPSLPNGLEINLVGEITSLPYIVMTKVLMESVGITVSFNGNQISIAPQKYIPKQVFYVESDWSSASYYYSLAALSKESKIQLSSYKKQSVQGDAKLNEIYDRHFGVKTAYQQNSIVLSKSGNPLKNHVNLNLNQTPDLAQTIAVNCAAQKRTCKLTGLATLKIKETNRLEALQKELTKIGAKVEIDNDSLAIVDFHSAQKKITIQTYQDHRMAMAFAPLATQQTIFIDQAAVVEKSYPNFWKDWQSLGFALAWT